MKSRRRLLAPAAAIMCVLALALPQVAQAGLVTYRSGAFIDNHWYTDRVVPLKGGWGSDGIGDWGVVTMESRYQNGSLYVSVSSQPLDASVGFSHPAITGYSRCKDDWPYSSTSGSLTCKRRV